MMASGVSSVPSTGGELVVLGDKVNREVFIGNVSKDTSKEALMRFLNDAMQCTGLSPTGYKSICACYVSDNFAFVECVTAEDASLILNLNRIPFKGMCLRVSRPSKYNGPQTPSKTWHDLACFQPNISSAMKELMMPVIADNKVNRELFIGNTTSEMTEMGLASFLNNAMEKVKMTTAPGSSITACHIRGKFGFVELRSVEETNNALNLNNIPYKGINLKISRPSKYAGPQYPVRTWQELTGEANATDQKALVADGTITDRELFLGNITSEMDKESLVAFLGNAMRQAGLATKGEGNPIIGCDVRVNFAFLEFRSVEETTNAMYLNNIVYLGVRLKVRRPSKYVGPDTLIRDWDELLTGLITGKGLAICNPGTSAMIDSIPKMSVEMTKQSTAHACLKCTASERTRILKLENMISKEDLECDSEYDDIVLETREECSEFGTLKNVIIPRTGKYAAKIFLEYETEDDAVNAMKQLAGRMFDGRRVEATYCTELELKNTSRKSRFGILESQ
eukprot:CAMPEP_0172485474 /NCGR_PEP_ID=MMETSP1066-20121228/13508_1 /TAXON_ID=671091 /ORGANISM="Coscinodiscus wailesii, Strain CCMP2513" /LENGTH=508 /DNA_ID=CAMNT_0013250759 /DNA_START=556 /DNA_END=2082 /DNA_ORIENTATION=+